MPFTPKVLRNEGYNSTHVLTKIQKPYNNLENNKVPKTKKVEWKKKKYACSKHMQTMYVQICFHQPPRRHEKILNATKKKCALNINTNTNITTIKT